MLLKSDFSKDINIHGVYSKLIKTEEEYKVSDEVKRIKEHAFYFPKYLKAHLDRGAKLLKNEFKYSRNFIDHLCKLEDSI